MPDCYSDHPKEGIIPGCLCVRCVTQREATQPPRNKVFHTLLTRMGEMHDKKSHDYADTASGHYYSNFEQTALTAGCSVDTVFRVLIGVKLARLDELLKGAKTPNHESVDDTLLDLSIYAALWASWRLSRQFSGECVHAPEDQNVTCLFHQGSFHCVLTPKHEGPHSMSNRGIA